jgi:HEPN domain-containing protein
MERGTLEGEAAWMEQIDRELRRAVAARGHGNEGQARVCARGAGGIAISHCLGTETGRPEGANVYDLLRWLRGEQAFRQEIRQAAARLTVRVTEQFELPHPEGPLGDAVTLINALLPAGRAQPGGGGEG